MYRFNIGFNGTGGGAAEFPPSGSYTATKVSNVSFRVYWTDVDMQGLVNVGDTFAVTGDRKPLPLGEDLTFYLYMDNMTLVQAANWRT
jgi:hypothetical protein